MESEIKDFFTEGSKVKKNWGDTRGQSPTQCSDAFNLHCYQLNGYSVFKSDKYSRIGVNGWYSSSIFRGIIYTDIDIIHTIWSSYYSFRRNL
jgi:hypothetical protein